MSRLLLKIETPVVNTAGTDPTLTEHLVPWMVRVRPTNRKLRERSPQSAESLPNSERAVMAAASARERRR